MTAVPASFESSLFAPGMIWIVSDACVSGSMMLTESLPLFRTTTRASSSAPSPGPTISVGLKPTGSVRIESDVESMIATEFKVSFAMKTSSPTTAGRENSKSSSSSGMKIALFSAVALL